MDLYENDIYSELRKTKEELQLSLNNCSPLIMPLIKEELEDINAALRKIECGTFGTCEISGELIPEDLLQIVPTLKSMDDCKIVKFFSNQHTK